jgi:hypothetical protein
MGGRLEARFERGEGPAEEADQAEGGLASVDARIGAGEVVGGQLPAPDLEVALGEGPVDRFRLGQGLAGERGQASLQGLRLGQRVGEALLGEVRKVVVVVVDADEGGVDGVVAVVPGEEVGQPGAEG